MKITSSIIVHYFKISKELSIFREKYRFIAKLGQSFDKSPVSLYTIAYYFFIYPPSFFWEESLFYVTGKKIVPYDLTANRTHNVSFYEMKFIACTLTIS